MYHDPIVQELHQPREELYQEFGNDPEAFVRHLQEREQVSGRRVQAPPLGGVSNRDRSKPLQLALFSDGQFELLSLLQEEGVAFQKRPPASEVPQNAGEVIEIATAARGQAVLGLIARALVAWLRARSSRKVMIQTDPTRVFSFSADGCSEGEIEALLRTAVSVMAFQAGK